MPQFANDVRGLLWIAVLGVALAQAPLGPGEARAQCIGFPVQTDQTCTNSGTLTNTSTYDFGGGTIANVGLQDLGTLTVSNTASGFISGTGAGVIFWGIGIYAVTANVTNSGTISGTSTGTIGSGIGIYAFGDADVTNYGTVSATGTGTTSEGAGYGIVAGNDAKVTNYGTISGTGNSTTTAGLGIGIYATNNAANVTNYGTISGTGTSGGLGVGIYAINNAANVTNYGTISGTGTGSVGFAYGISASNDANVTNYGTISGTGAGSGSVAGFGVGIEAGNDANVINYGTISGTGTGTGNAVVGYGISAGNDANVTNYGTIAGTGTGSFGVGNGISAGNNANVTNYGTILGTGGSVNFGLAPAGAAVYAKTVNVTNESGGLISGNIGIFAYGAASTIVNDGTITGTRGTAIRFGAGNNTLTIGPTSVINGSVLGSGSDIFQLGGSGQGAFDIGTIGTGQQYSGFSTFNKIGDSTWILSGSGTQTWNVLAGTIDGNFTAGGLNVAAGATVSPGASIGTITINGNVSLAAGSIYKVEANSAGQSDKIAATGTAVINGATLQASFAGGSYGLSTVFNILSASGGVTGTFANLAADGSFGIFLAPSLSYTAQSVLLTLTRTPFSAAAQTPNQFAAADAVQNDTTALGTALVNLTNYADARAGFDALSGEVHASAQTTLLDDSRFVRQAVLGRLRQIPYAGEAGGMAALGSGGPMLAYARAAAPAFPVKAMPGKAPEPRADYSVWAQGIGSWGEFGSDGDAADAHRTFGGFFTGVDGRFGQWRLGLVTGYSQSNVDIDDRLSSARIETAYAGAYGATSIGAFAVRSGAVYAFHRLDTARTIAFQGFADRTEAHYDGGTAQLFGEVGYGMRLGALATEPFAGLAWAHLDTQSFGETGGLAALSGDSNREDVGYSTLGWRAASTRCCPTA